MTKIKHLNISDVEELINMKKSSIYKYEKLNMFPKRVKFGRSTFWIESEVEAWMLNNAEMSRAA